MAGCQDGNCIEKKKIKKNPKDEKKARTHRLGVSTVVLDKPTTFRITCDQSAVSLLESGEQLYIKAINNNNNNKRKGKLPPSFTVPSTHHWPLKLLNPNNYLCAISRSWLK